MEEARGDAGLRALLVASAGLLLLAGCGEDKSKRGGATTVAKPPPTVAIAPEGPPLSKSEYEARFKAIVTRFENGPRIDPPEDASLEEQGDAFDRAIARVREVAAELGKLNPPAEVRGAHVDFVNGMREIADDIEPIARALHDGDKDEAERLVDLSPGGFAEPSTIRKLAAARAEFQRKGYDLGEVSQFP